MPARKGWLTTGKMAQELGVGQVYIRLCIRDLRERGEKIEVYRAMDFDGHSKLHYSPAVVKLVAAAAQETDRWHSLTDLGTLLDEPLPNVRGAVMALNKSKYWDPKFCVLGAKGEYRVSPLMLPMLKSVFLPVKGWRTLGEIIKRSNLDFSFIRFFMKEVKSKNPQFFKQAPNEKGRWRIRCSPGAVRVLNEKIRRLESGKPWASFPRSYWCPAAN